MATRVNAGIFIVVLPKTKVFKKEETGGSKG